MTVHRGIDILTVHTDEKTREIWFGTGRPRASKWQGDGPDEFARVKWVSEAETIRILGTEANADMIVQLHNQRLKTGMPHDIEIGGPWSCRIDEGPDAVFHDMLENQLPSSVGGWHKLSESDYRTYAVLAAFRKDGYLSDYVGTLLRVHPAYPAFSFVEGIDWDYAIELLRLLVDPRFLVDPRYPDRFSRTKQFFGLASKDHNGTYNARAFMTGRDGCQSLNYRRAKIVFGTWFREDCNSELGPKDFLMRAFHARAKGAREEPREMALVQASQIFLRFVRDVWLDFLTPPRVYRTEYVGRKGSKIKDGYQRIVCSDCYNPTLFVPGHFFRHRDEDEAWKKHVA